MVAFLKILDMTNSEMNCQEVEKFSDLVEIQEKLKFEMSKLAFTATSFEP